MGVGAEARLGRAGLGWAGLVGQPSRSFLVPPVPLGVGGLLSERGMLAVPTRFQAAYPQLARS